MALNGAVSPERRHRLSPDRMRLLIVSSLLDSAAFEVSPAALVADSWPPAAPL